MVGLLRATPEKLLEGALPPPIRLLHPQGNASITSPAYVHWLIKHTSPA